MGQLLDRDYQREILNTLSHEYPNTPVIRRIFNDTDRRFSVNAMYLHEHGLVNARAAEVISGEREIIGLEITARGLDFLQGDGGLSAILGVVTVKLHDDTIKALLIDKIASASGDQGVKDQLIETINSLPAEATRSVAMRLLEGGLEAAPRSLEALQTWLGF